jgi:CRISPR-associated protein Cmr4
MMFQASSILFLYVETPLHAGSGAGLGAVDLPIQRERVTGYPLVQASGLKGALRSVTSEGDDVNIVFGPDGHEHAGAVSFGDARLLLFPVRSLVGVFGWTTSRDVLARFRRDAKEVGLNVPPLPDAPEGDAALISPDCKLVPEGESQLVLEEFAFTTQKSQEVEKLAEWLRDEALPQGDEYGYWHEKLPRSLVILPEDDFRDFTLHATEVVTRVRLKRETKTVEGGALWTEEHLPADTLLYAPVLASAPRQRPDDLPPTWKDKGARDVLAKAKELALDYLQLGGEETVGRGMVRLRWADGGKGNV